MNGTSQWPAGIVRAEAPWVAHGDAYLVLTASSRADNLADAGICDALRAGYRNFGNALMAVEYRQSPVGPYLELLYVPGRFAVADAPASMSISRIYVDSEASVLNGRANWGLPKQRAEFSRRTDGEGRDEFRLGPEGDWARLSFQAFGPSFSLAARWLPARLRTFVQIRDGVCFRFTLGMSGRIRAARVFPHGFDPTRFPDLQKRKILAAVHIRDFTLRMAAATCSAAPL